ncbi:hypothetical protein ACJJTC_001763 [Scirpophaga incertulas]
MYYGNYGQNCNNRTHETSTNHPMSSDGYGNVRQRVNSTVYPMNYQPGPVQMPSGIDPRYLATYSDNSASYILPGQHAQDESSATPLKFGSDYENRNYALPDRSKTNMSSPQAPKEMLTRSNEMPALALPPKPIPRTSATVHSVSKIVNPGKSADLQQRSTNNKTTAIENLHKEETQLPIATRSDKLKALHKAGPRAFSGPVEKILKWHKSLQDIGVLVLYEVVAKCVSVSQGKSSAKNLVVRDDNGPAMQVVYYEIDFLLPELKPPCTIRVVGRMMMGTSRLHAFNVRPATGDDVSTLPRRAAVAAHHVAKIVQGVWRVN